ncbi:hybrid sensor histidine kinase/response regulator transcription factor [Sphingobacterium sp. BIGb0165]|uniref:hybrid sensor histidine kinase/response regulator transcription factor n=1 Tax=Sphingobacterium sp. BIGb0165 TaxID=2940615 RepID=UPI002166F1C9|nr:hybrid sensor histidine kinase/response regulator transcription factor [Sphingobacterium sp. BIGb0165]MCS4229022.1 signal transduction histidine kinase/ligand-binding sensor domain-containing protein/DNA-binding response OmpR family regulator [Sphingobacterium sp. BIGb0165]
MRVITLIPILYLLLVWTNLQAQSFYFKNYQPHDGLSNSSVKCITQDTQGFLWLGTRNGLNRFDGNQFKIFRHNASDPTSIGSSSILSILTDSKGILWVGTTRGTYCYNPVKENFQPFNRIPIGEVNAIHEYAGFIWLLSAGKLYRYNPYTTEIVPFDQNKNTLVAITSSKKGGLWTTDINSTIERYQVNEGKFVQIAVKKTNRKALANTKTVYAINDSLLMVGTINSSYLFDFKNGTLKNLFANHYPQKVIQANCIIQQTESVYWIGTETGIYTYDIHTGQSQHIKKDLLNPFAISDNAVLNFYRDREDNIWFGTFFGGFNQYSNQFDNFKKYLYGFGKSALSGNIVHDIKKDNYGNFWIGTEDGGLNKIDAQTQQIQHFVANGKKGSIAHNNVHGLATIGDELWVGSTTHGLDILDVKTGELKKHYDRIGRGPLQSSFAVCIFKSRDNSMFVGTDRALYAYNKHSDSFDLLPIKAWIQGIYEDEYGILWVNTYGSGVYQYNRGTGEIQHLSSEQGKRNTLVNNYVNGLFEDSKKNLWFCTESGLSKYRRDGHFTNYLTESGLPSNQVFKVLEDDNNSIWISTGGGLVRLDGNIPHMVIYTSRDGLPADQFNYNSAFKDKDGTLYFGTIKGMVSFNPTKSIKNSFIPPIFISDIQINNESIPVRENGILKQSISLSKEIQLSYNSSNISFNIAALSFVSPKSNAYRYIMEGYDKGWTDITGNQKIYYNKLPPGTYTFRFKGANNNGIWNPTEKELRIVVSPPWWLSSWAYFAYFFAVSTIVLLILRYYFLLIKANNAQKMDNYERKKEQEVYNLKLEFFTNLAHEIRTPLTLIKMPLEKIIRTQQFTDSETASDLALMEKNTSRLIRLTNQLLDFRKAETNNMSLIFTKTDINSLLSDVFNDLNSLAKEKLLHYDLSLPRITLTAFVDEEALRKILTNLIHNGIKYADNHVHIKLLPFNSDDIMFNVEFRNDGEIIPFDKREKIFEPFYRLNESDKDTGTGIGLPLSRSLVELHQGSLSLVYTEEHRNIFLLSLPIFQEQSLDIKPFLEENYKTEDRGMYTKEEETTEKPVILIVEDNKEILAYLNKELKINYTILRANNGAEALEILDRDNVQLVLTDIMMPIMDGIALCKRIKTDILYSHIPVIFLTAKNALDAKIQGLKIGADAYIEKPFSMEFLMVQLRNILNNRKIIKNYFTNSPSAHLAEINVSAPDKDFISLLNTIIYDNISDIDLNVEELAKLMNMSRPTLYRKIKGLSDLTPNELINISRLKKAAELLTQKEYNITQISTMVGYTVQSNFSRDFHKHYGMPPSTYIIEHSKQ